MRVARRRGWGITTLALVLGASSLAAGGPASPAAGGGGDGRPAPTCFGLAVTRLGTAGDDTITGTAADDVISGLDGNDNISGLGGNDRICGDDGNDTVLAGSGKDRVQGGPGNDAIVGALGADTLRGGAGADRVRGGGGDDTIFGEAGTDALNGEAGTDTCANGETLLGCEVVPPSGCSNPALAPATAHTTNVTVTGSNAYEWTDPYWIIEGTRLRIRVIAEVRNGTGGYISIGEAKIAVYDSEGDLVGKRLTHTSDQMLAPGERTILSETWPSTMYLYGETNRFPTGWVSWELTLSAVPADWADSTPTLPSTLQHLSADSPGEVSYRLAVVNTLGDPADFVGSWIAVYDSDRALLNLIWDADNPEGGLAPGAEIVFEGTYEKGPTCFASARWGAIGQSWSGS